jgi:hypothetical protein
MYSKDSTVLASSSCRNTIIELSAKTTLRWSVKPDLNPSLFSNYTFQPSKSTSTIVTVWNNNQRYRRLWPRRPTVSSLYVFSFSSQFFLLRSSIYPQPRRLMDYAHPEPPWAGSRCFPLIPPVLLDTVVISVSFYCVHTEPRAPSCPVYFALFRKASSTASWYPSHWALWSLERFQSTMPYVGASDRFWNASELSYQNPHRSNQLWIFFALTLPFT